MSQTSRSTCTKMSKSVSNAVKLCHNLLKSKKGGKENINQQTQMRVCNKLQGVTHDTTTQDVLRIVNVLPRY